MKKKVCPFSKKFSTSRGARKKNAMKRSQADEDVDLSRRRLLEKHAQLERDLESLRSEQTKTTKELEELARRTIAENIGKISPFRDTFVQKLGTIVDFGHAVKGGRDVSVLVERYAVAAEEDDDGYDDGYYWLRHDSQNGDIIMTTVDILMHESLQDIVDDLNLKNYARHVFIGERGRWTDCAAVDCACRKEHSDTRKMQAFVKKFSWSIIALMHDMRRLYEAFFQDPKQRYNDIMDAAFTDKKKKHKKNKKHKKDDKE